MGSKKKKKNRQEFKPTEEWKTDAKNYLKDIRSTNVLIGIIAGTIITSGVFAILRKYNFKNDEVYFNKKNVVPESVPQPQEEVI